ncbi:ankyrin repeat domain-containing protein [Candidatus Mesenet endosymbiont of Agriotes lineatus]|uniref:ankyrin repeat domain-containing protein n=1 Tax=Candidatus Mesenet endosymbiont of Agriotes lineatus TaxID=3077948 RepID=UPI0030D11982
MHGQFPIHQAIEQNDYQNVLELINKATSDDVNATNRLDQTPLHLAIAAKHLGGVFTDFRDEVINALIAKNANVNAQDSDGETPVHYISRWLRNDNSDKKVKSQIYNNVEKWLDKNLISSLECLIKGDSNVNIEDNTALDYILNYKELNQYKAMNTIELLLKADAEIKTSAQALKVIDASILYSEDSLEIIKLVIPKYLVDINYQDAKKNTALSLAYEKKKFDVIKYLIENSADPGTIIPSTGKNFITHVVEENLFDLVPSLKFDTILINDFTPLIIAMNSGNYNSVKTLIEKHKANVNFSDGFGKKPIYYAAAGGSTAIVEYLLNHGADIKGLDGNGNTALHYAAANKDGNENISFLIEKGVDVNYRDKHGNRPISLAIANNLFNNFQTLLNNGATLEMKDFEGVESINPFIVVIALMRNHPVTELY